MASSLNGTGVTFSNGSTQSVAWPGNTGTVTSVATGNGLTGGTITGSGTISLDIYTGTSQNNTSFAVGTYIQTNYGSGVNIYTAISIWSPPSAGATAFSSYGSQGSGSGALAGTWRSMGLIVQTGCGTNNVYLMQRKA